MALPGSSVSHLPHLLFRYCHSMCLRIDYNRYAEMLTTIECNNRCPLAFWSVIGQRDVVTRTYEETVRQWVGQADIATFVGCLRPSLLCLTWIGVVVVKLNEIPVRFALSPCLITFNYSYISYPPPPTTDQPLLSTEAKYFDYNGGRFDFLLLLRCRGIGEEEGKETFWDIRRHVGHIVKTKKHNRNK